jgi:hypothetical protein
VGIKITPPKRHEPVVDRDRNLLLRTQRYFSDISDYLETLPNQGTTVADITVSTTANNTAKINELLAVLRTAGVIAT